MTLLNDNKTTINWLIPIYPTLSKDVYKTRKCKI